MTKIGAGGKFLIRIPIKFSGGLHGVGCTSVVNALSNHLRRPVL